MGNWSRWGGTAVGALTGGVSGAAVGLFSDTERQGQQSAEEAAAAEQARIAAAMQQRDANIGQLRSLFGMGQGAEADKNRQTIAEAINRYYQTSLRQNLGQAEQGFAGTSRVTRQNLARVGQLGSGLDASAQTANLADFIRARQKAISGAAGARDSLQSRLSSQRMGLESQIASGTQAAPDFAGAIAQRDQTLSQAQQQIVPQQLGNLFSAAGQGYFQGRVQEAEGNQGLRAFGLGGGGGGSGRVT